jgi:tetratricopeptide (TPR) repeat protein
MELILMVVKLTAILAKKEAEIYCAQGLHQEAIDLYARLLDTCPNIPPGIKKNIKTQIGELFEEKKAFIQRRGRQPDAAEIRRIRKGWGNQASVKDILICAQSFFKIGAYQEALDEYVYLLKKGNGNKTLADPIAECLVRCHQPQELPKAVMTICRQLFTQPKTALVFQLQLVKPLSRHPDHAVAYCDHLKNMKDLPAALASRLDAVNRKLKSTTLPDPQPQVRSPESWAAPPPVMSSPASRWRRWITALIGGKGRS